MASHEQIYTTKILLNSEQATKEIDKLDKKVKELKKRRKDIAPLDSKAIQAANKEIEKQEKKLGIMRNRLTGINKALDDMSAVFNGYYVKWDKAKYRFFTGNQIVFGTNDTKTSNEKPPQRCAGFFRSKC